jgi:membrane-associated phospholipid phosphatase
MWKSYSCRKKNRTDVLKNVMKKISINLHARFIGCMLIIAGWNIVPAIAQSQLQSPYKLSWDTDKYICLPGAVGFIGGYIAEQSVQPLTAQEISTLSRSSVNEFDRSATYRYSKTASDISDAVYGVAAIAPCLLFTDETMRKDWQTISVMYLETLEWFGATTMIAKGTVQRIRPYAYNPDVAMEEKYSRETQQSFFSGHSTIAFASAVFISTVYCEYHPDSEWKPYIWTGSLLAAGTVGYLRYAAGQHYPSDILVGVVVGSALGYTIPWLHKTQFENTKIGLGMYDGTPRVSVMLKF